MKIEQMFCPCCDVLRLEGKDLVSKTMALELAWEAYWHEGKGIPPLLEISSGYRCQRHNIEVGGTLSSQHLRSRALDIRKKDCTPLTDTEADVLYRLAEQVGFNGIALYSHHIHVDTRVGAPYRKNNRA